MKKLLALISLISWMPLGHADDCGERIVSVMEPIFPHEYNAVHVINKEKICAIDVAYSVNYEGHSENIVSRAQKDTCQVFKVSAMRAVRDSTFAPGDYLNLCYMTLVYRLEEGRLKWEYTPISFQ